MVVLVRKGREDKGYRVLYSSYDIGRSALLHGTSTA